MRKLALAFCILLAALSSFNMDAASKKKKKSVETEVVKPAPKKQTPYQKLMKEVSDSAVGGFVNIYKTKKDKIYMGYPVSLAGRRILAGGTVASTSNPASVDIGKKYSDPIYLQVEVKDSVVLLLRPTDGATASDELQKALSRTYAPKVYKRLPINCRANDMVIFEITALVKDLMPKSSTLTASKEDITWFGECKSFSDNASIKVHSNVDVSRSVLGIKVKLGDASISSNVSFLLLPKRLMAPRVNDSRIGVFTTTGPDGTFKYRLSDEQDGLKPYILANRWRLELSDTLAWQAGKSVKVTTPIVWYIDDSFPSRWKSSIHKGVLVWNEAFREIGLEGVMEARDFPSLEEDPEFDPDNLRYSCIRYVPNSTMNASGPSWTDPVTGEILNASVFVYNDVLRLVNNWRFVQTAQVDPRVRSSRLPDEVFDESLTYVISHEIGHTLGLLHNMGASSTFPVDSLRSASFTNKYGITPSIMDYARFNYVAQPGDKGLKLTAPSLGVYDKYAIKWLYQPVPQARDMWDEARIASAIIEEHENDPFYRYGAQQVGSSSSSYGDYDPSARSEDIGDDPVKAGGLAVSNLKYILSHLNEWIEDDEEYTYRGGIYTQIVNQYLRYLDHALAQVGGIRLYQVKAGAAHKPAEPVAKDVQRQALKWVISQIRDASWIDNGDVTSHLPLHAPYSATVASSIATELTSDVPSRIILCSALAEDAYTLMNYYDDLYKEAFASSLAGKPLSIQERTLQRSLLTAAASPLIAAQNKTKLAEDAELESFGEGRNPYQKSVSITAIDETLSYQTYFVSKLNALAARLRTSGPAQDRPHYEYIYRTTTAALAK